MRRRSFLAATVAMFAARSGVAAASTSRIAQLPLEFFDPRRPVDKHYATTRTIMIVPAEAEALVARLWQVFLETSELKYGEWALMYTLNWWRAVDLGAPRVRTSRIGIRMAQAITQQFPSKSMGPFWTAVFVGAESISRGILDAIQNVPEFQRNLAIAEKEDPSYMYGSPILLQAKMFIKLPPFPVSIGDLDKGVDYLERARPHAERKMAFWDIFLAEAVYLKSGRDACFQILDRIAEHVKPVDGATMFVYEMTLSDAASMRAAITNGTYNKYTWDPMLSPLNLADRPPAVLP